MLIINETKETAKNAATTRISRGTQGFGKSESAHIALMSGRDGSYCENRVKFSWGFFFGGPPIPTHADVWGGFWPLIIFLNGVFAISD